MYLISPGHFLCQTFIAPIFLIPSFQMHSFTSLFSLAHLCLLLELATGQTNGIDLRD